MSEGGWDATRVTPLYSPVDGVERDQGDHFAPPLTLSLWPSVPRGFATSRTQRLLTSMGVRSVGMGVGETGGIDVILDEELRDFAKPSAIGRPIDRLDEAKSSRLSFHLCRKRRGCGVQTGNSANIACRPFSFLVQLSSCLMSNEKEMKEIFT